MALQNFWTNLQAETVRSCKLGLAHNIQSEGGSSVATPTQLGVVNVVQHVIFKQNILFQQLRKFSQSLLEKCKEGNKAWNSFKTY